MKTKSKKKQEGEGEGEGEMIGLVDLNCLNKSNQTGHVLDCSPNRANGPAEF